MKSESIPVGQYQILNSKPLVLSVPTDLLETERMDIEYYQPHFIEMQNRVNQSGLDLPTLDTLRDPKRVITDGIREHVKTSSGVILIRTQNFGDPTLTLEDCVYVDHAQHSAAKKSAVRSGDLLIAIRGYLGKAVIVTNDVPEANINQHIARISVNPHCADSGYLWAFFTSPTGTTQLERQVTGTVQQGIMLPSLRRLPVPLPPRPVQEYIGAKVRLAERCRLQARELWKNSEAILADALGMSLDSANYEQIDKAQLRSADYQLSSVSPVAAWVTSSMVNGAISPQYFHPRRTNVILKLRSLGVEIKRLAELAIRRSDRVTPEQANGLSWYVGLAEIDSV